MTLFEDLENMRRFETLLLPTEGDAVRHHDYVRPEITNVIEYVGDEGPPSSLLLSLQRIVDQRRSQ